MDAKTGSRVLRVPPIAADATTSGTLNPFSSPACPDPEEAEAVLLEPMLDTGKIVIDVATAADDKQGCGCCLRNVDLHQMLEKKRPKSTAQKCTLSLLVIGSVFSLTGLVCFFITKPIVEEQILLNLPLRNGTEAYKNWKDPPVHPIMSLRFFNLTNKEDFLQGRSKPILTEVGPYVYRTDLHQTHLSISDDEDHIAFMSQRYYYFAPKLTFGSEEDVIVMPNVPLLGAMQALAKERDIAKSMFESFLGSYDFAMDKDPFMALTVKQLLWGYPSVLLSLDRARKGDCSSSSSSSAQEASRNEDEWADFGVWDEPFGMDRRHQPSPEASPFPSDGCDIRPGNLVPFGLFVGKNGTSSDHRKIRTGVKDITKKGEMVEWHGKAVVDFWKDRNASSHCNKVTGNDPSSLPLHLTSRDVIPSYIGQLCRRIDFKYVKEVQVGESEKFDTLRFVPLENTFDNPDVEPDNDCYCLEKPCLPSGLLDISGCQHGSSVIMSWPHFLHGDAKLLQGVVGLSPDPEIHSFTLDLVPKYGVALSALARLQLNVRIVKGSGFSYFNSILDDEVYLPFLWLEEGIVGPSDIIVEKMTFLLGLPNKVSLSSIMVIVFGLILIIVAGTVSWFIVPFLKSRG